MNTALVIGGSCFVGVHTILQLLAAEHGHIERVELTYL